LKEGYNWIPLLQGNHAISIAELAGFRLVGKMRSVLIVDDEIGVRESLKLLLRNDYEVLLAKNAEEAFSQIKEHSPEVILLDVTLPDLDGLKVLQIIKQDNPNVIVIVITGIMTMEMDFEAKKLGAYACVAKPYDIHELRLIIAQSLPAKALFTSTSKHHLPDYLTFEDK